MTEYAEIDALLQDAIDDEDAVNRLIADRVHDFETQLHRPLSEDEVEQLAAQVASEHAEANAHADRVAEHFSADLDEQLPRLELDLGRKLLAHEVQGIVELANHALTTRGETADAADDYERYWAHREIQTGETPPDMSRSDQAAKYTAQRVRDLAQAEPAPPENDSNGPDVSGMSQFARHDAWSKYMADRITSQETSEAA